jgi:hypothetical protein
MYLAIDSTMAFYLINSSLIMKYKILSVAICALILSTSSTVLAREGEESMPNREQGSNYAPLRAPGLDRRGIQDGDRKVGGMGMLSTTTRRDMQDDHGRLEDMRMRGIGSTTRAETKDMRYENREKIGDMRDDAKMRMRNASSSDERKEIRTNLRKDMFKAHQGRLTAQLGLALENLKQIRTRISARIDKAEASGRTMTDAKALLVIADAKIAIAATEIANLSSFVPPVATSSLTSAADDASSEVELEKPRRIADTAIKALKDARKALVDVMIAVAKNMGIRCNAEGESLRCQSNATTTPPTNTPPVDTATTTP